MVEGNIRHLSSCFGTMPGGAPERKHAHIDHSAACSSKTDRALSHAIFLAVGAARASRSTSDSRILS